MSATRKPRPAATLIREETPDNQLTMLAIQVDHTMHVVEAMASVLINIMAIAKDHPQAEDSDEDKALLKAIETGLDRLSAVLGGSN